jgi:Tfp pilus assembly protein PilW
MKALRPQLRAFTLVEASVTAAVMSLVLAAVTVGALSLQRSFAASQDFITSHLEQVRALDTMKRDARSAKAMEVSPDGQSVVFTIPATQPGLLSLQLPSTVLGLLTPNGSVSAPAETTVTYTYSGRQLTRSDASGMKSVATRQSRFQVQQNGSQLLATFSFPSRYSKTPAETPATTMSSSVSFRASNW